MESVATSCALWDRGEIQHVPAMPQGYGKAVQHRDACSMHQVMSWLPAECTSQQPVHHLTGLQGG